MNQGGQMTIEMILMTVLTLAIVLLVSKSSGTWLSNLAEGPQSFMTGMMQDAEWMSADKSKTLNPNFKAHRHGSYKPNGQ